MPCYFTNGDAKSDPLVKGSVLCNATFCVCVCEHAQSFLTLWDPMDWSPPGSSVH